MLPIKEPVVYNLVKQQMVGLEDMFSVTAWVKLPEYSEGILVRTHISKLLIEDIYISLDDILIRIARDWAIGDSLHTPNP